MFIEKNSCCGIFCKVQTTNVINWVLMTFYNCFYDIKKRCVQYAPQVETYKPES